MTIQTFYPVFESGQVLTEAALNDIIDYLEPQDRDSRALLAGIGILCGLTPQVGQGGTRLTVTRGVAVTSGGFLIARPETAYALARPYDPPVPKADQATADDIARARYSFLFDGAQSRAAWELFEPGFQTPAGQAAPQPLTQAFLQDKVLMLFLEERRDGLRNCDVNDCSDKGAELHLTLRPLLVARATAERILADEAALAPGIPVERARHPRLALAGLQVPRLRPYGSGAAQDYPALFSRQVGIGLAAMRDAALLIPAARQAHAAQLAPEVPADPPPQLFLPMAGHWAAQPLMAQCLYEAAGTIAQALDEVIEAGARLDAECLPDRRRFPRHVLCGLCQPPDAPPADPPRDMAELANFDPAKIAQGPAGGRPPAALRHAFIPAPTADPGGRAGFLALWHRLHLLPLSYHTQDLAAADIRISPSSGAAFAPGAGAALARQAVPAWARVDPSSALTAVWSAPHPGTNPDPATPAGWRLLPERPEETPPLYGRTPGAGFLRIEGAVGHSLGHAWARILQLKQALDLPFSVVPVLAPTGDAKADAMDLVLAQAALSPVLGCALADLDSTLRTLVQGFLPFLAGLARTLAELEATRTLRTEPVVPDRPEVVVQPPVDEGFRVPFDESIIFSLPEGSILRRRSELVERVRELAVQPAETAGPRPSVILSLMVADAPQAAGSLGALSTLGLLQKVRAAGDEAEMIDRLRRVLRDEGMTAEEAGLRAQAVFPVVSLMNRIEAAIELLGRLSIDSYDAAQVERVLGALMLAFDGYAARAETDPERAGEAVARANRAILASRATLAAGLAPFGSGAIGAEIDRRTALAAAGLQLPAYAAAHPGLDHGGGVAAGGTLVLLFCHRDRVIDMFMSMLIDLWPEFSDTWKVLFGTDAPRPDIDAVDKALTRGPRNRDLPLDDFVVLGDLWHPGQACGPLCDDARVQALLSGKLAAPRPGPQPRPIVMTGRLSGRVLQLDGQSGTTKALAGAEVFLQTEGGNLEMTVSDDAGQWSFVISEDTQVLLIARHDGRESDRVPVMATALLPNPAIDLTIRV